MKFIRVTSRSNGASFLLNLDDVSSISPGLSMDKLGSSGSTISLKNGYNHLVEEAFSQLDDLLGNQGILLLPSQES